MEDPQSQPPTKVLETQGQEKARLRRERREAKLKAEGTSRLEKITKVSGRQNLPDAPSLAPTSPSSTGDPDEVDLSTHPSATRTPNLQNGDYQPTEADIRALLRAGAPQPGVDTQPNQAGGEEDPMMKLLSQLMGGMPGSEGEDSGLPPGLAAMLGGMGGGAGPRGETQQAPKGNTYDYVWKIVHALFAVVLGVYVTAACTAFEGPVVRLPGKVLWEGTQPKENINLFWLFATAELVLQSSRFFLERGRIDSQLGGWMGMASGMLPEPYGSYLRLVGRYSGIWSTIVEDAMVLVFIVGVVSWWKGTAG